MDKNEAMIELMIKQISLLLEFVDILDTEVPEWREYSNSKLNDLYQKLFI